MTDIKNSVNGAYKRVLGSASTSIRLVGLAPNNVFVFGEVKAPGPVVVTGPRTVVQLVAAAGGTLPTAALDQVRIIYFDPGGDQHIRTVDINRLSGRHRLRAGSGGAA